MAQFANPADIKNLNDWVARFGKYQNVVLDKKTGEPVVLEAKKDNPAVVLRIPWKREGDTITVLTNPSRFSAASVAASAQRYEEVVAPVSAAASTDALRAIERRLLDAWRAYRASPSIPLMKDVNGIEKELLAFELSLTRPDRAVLDGRYMVPILPVDRRAIGIADVGSATRALKIRPTEFSASFTGGAGGAGGFTGGSASVTGGPQTFRERTGTAASAGGASAIAVENVD